MVKQSIQNAQHLDTEQSNTESSLPRAERRLGAAGRFYLVSLSLSLLVALFFLVLFYPRLFVTIHTGERGVLWSRWTGTQLNEVYIEGTQFVWPWNKMVIYDIRYKVADQTLVLLSNDGLPISVEMMIRYRPADRLLGRLHEQVGPDYLNVVVLPEVATALRKVVSKFSVEDLYQSKFGDIRDEMLAEARKETGKRFVILDDVMFKSIRLPETVSQAIQQKVKQEQASEEMTYVLSMEQAEAERKLIEAKGIEEQQRHINNTLTDRLLQYKSIEAAKALAASPNAKIIVMGGGGRGATTPIILNPGDQPASPEKR